MFNMSKKQKIDFGQPQMPEPQQIAPMPLPAPVPMAQQMQQIQQAVQQNVPRKWEIREIPVSTRPIFFNTQTGQQLDAMEVILEILNGMG